MNRLDVGHPCFVVYFFIIQLIFIFFDISVPCRWLKSDVIKKASAEKDGPAKRVSGDKKHRSCTTLDDCFAKFTQPEKVTACCLCWLLLLLL